MSKKSAAYIALSFSLLILSECGVVAGTIAHPEIAVYRSTSADSGPNPIEENGYQQGSTGAVEIPGVLDIVPGGPDWPNFITAAQLSQPYTVQAVKLVKQTPAQNVVPERFPQHTVTQADDNIRLHWPLMYDAPGTTFTLTIDYTTTLSQRLPGETASSELHQEVWKWMVAARVQDIDRTQDLFYSMPFGRSGVPLISDEALNSTLLADATAQYLAGDFAGLSITLATYRSIVSDSQITTAPPYPIPGGPGAGIANTLENPAACILLMDVAFMEPRSIGSAGSTVADAADTTAVMFANPKVVTLVGDGWFYAQDLNRLGGLKVIGAKAGLSEGTLVLLQGIIGTQGPERVLLMTGCETVATGTLLAPAIRPLAMPNRTVGGAGLGCLPGFSDMAGLWNGGLLVRTAGRVTAAVDDFFYIDDGSGRRDGTQYAGLRVILPGGATPPATNAYVAVTGVSSWFDNEGYSFPAVLLGSDGVTVVRPGP